MSDSEDDFMSDKFLVEAPTASQTYSDRRSTQQLKSLRAGQAKNIPSMRVLEAERRREGLATSLFDRKEEGVGDASRGGLGSGKKDGEGAGPGGSGGGGGNKAMELMMKMGWKKGESLGRKRSPSPPPNPLDPSSSTNISSKRARPNSPPRHKQSAEPIRISLWSGRKGISARDPSPPPLPTSGRNVDALDPKKLERLGKETETFRERQRREFGEREVERKEIKARDMLVQFDAEKGVKFHPLHALPSNPLLLPRPLLKLIYPAQISPTPSRSPSPEPIQSYTAERNVSAAERLRDQMRRDMLTEVGEEDDLVFGERAETGEKGNQAERGHRGAEGDWEDVDWDAQVSSTKKVLAMDPITHLTFLVSQLRHEHLFCFWCAYKYSSYEEMEAPGGCPGEDEDDH